VWLTRSFPVGRAGPRREPGARFTGVTGADGRRILSASVTLSGAVSQPPPLSDRPPVHTRHFPAWEPGEAAMEELVLAATTDTEFAGIWAGQAELAFHDVRDADLARLAPVETIAGYVFSYAETLTPGQRVRAASQRAGTEPAPR
jgi:hypothetical protein